MEIKPVRWIDQVLDFALQHQPKPLAISEAGIELGLKEKARKSVIAH